MLLGLILSVAAGLWAGRQTERITRNWPLSPKLFRLCQIPGAAGTAFFHGAQDGQKFIGVFLLGAALAQGRQEAQVLSVPLWLMALCAAAMAAGTALGGRRIIDTVGREMVTLGPGRGLLPICGHPVPAGGHPAGTSGVHHPHQDGGAAGGGSRGTPGRGPAGGPLHPGGLAGHLPGVHGPGLWPGEGRAGPLGLRGAAGRCFFRGDVDFP